MMITSTSLSVINTSNVGELATVERGPSVNLAADCAVRNVHSPSSHLPRHHYVFGFFGFFLLFIKGTVNFHYLLEQGARIHSWDSAIPERLYYVTSVA